MPSDGLSTLPQVLAKDVKRVLATSTVSLEVSPVQTKVFKAVMSGQYRYVGMGGGIRGTKTYGMLIVLIALCRMYPGSRWAIVRKDLQTLRRNTQPTLDKIRLTCARFVGELNQSDWTYTCANGSQIIFFGANEDRDPDLNRWRGLEVNGFLLEEANELEEKSFHKAIERAGAWIIPPTIRHPNPNQPRPLILCTFNPCDNWPRHVFYEPYMDNTIGSPYFYQPATLADNPYASQEYRDSLKEGLPDEEYRMFVLGDWGVVRDPRKLIQSQWILNATARPDGNNGIVCGVPAEYGQLYEGLDIARFGDDYTVFARRDGNALIELVAYKGMDLSDIPRIAANRIMEGNMIPSHMIVDAVGMGAGPADTLRGMKLDIKEFIAGAKMVERRTATEDETPLGSAVAKSFFKFDNLRSQAWWEFREKLRLGQVRLDVTHKMLVQDLLAVGYDIKADKTLVVDDKATIKEKTGRSTDFGDAVVQAYFDMAWWKPPEYEPKEYARVQR